MNVLLTAIGKRVQLVEHLKTQFKVIGVDASDLNPAKNFVDAFYVVPEWKETEYLETLLKICKKEQVDILIPLYEQEFLRLSEAENQFDRIGTRLLLSDYNVIDICNDKVKTAAFFEKCNIATPKTLTEEEILYPEEHAISYPLIVKPLDGMGSSNVFKIHNKAELQFFYEYVKKPMVQICAKGTEYTIDVLCDLHGMPIYIVPRIRLEVRSGEVTKSRTVRQELIIKETTRLLECLNKAGTVRGPMTIQCFLAEDLKSLQFIEINPRFGGGVPLSFAAGADYATAIKAMHLGEEVPYREERFRELTMMRYELAVFEE